MALTDIKLFSGNANPRLALAIARRLGIALGKITVGRFSDGEIMVEIMEHVRGHHVFIVQPISAPTNDHLMELLIMTDAFRRASASRVTAIMPYLGYARQDRRSRSLRVPISAKVVANAIVSAGVSHVLTVDLHADQIQGFFDIPLDNVYASPVLLGDLWKLEYPKLMVVAPDVGGVVRARALAKRLDDTGLAVIDKRRPKPNVAEIMHVIGKVRGRSCVIVDDLVDTAGTLCQAAQALKERGALRVVAYCTHPVLSGNAIDNISNSELDELVVTDTIPLHPDASVHGRIRQLSVAGMLAESIRRIAEDESVSSLFMD